MVVTHLLNSHTHVGLQSNGASHRLRGRAGGARAPLAAPGEATLHNVVSPIRAILPQVGKWLN